MNPHFLKPLVILSLAAMAPTARAVWHEPYDGSRIYWDLSSQSVLFPSGNYARIIQLQDGRLMAAAEAGGGISVCYSENVGQTWSTPELIQRSASLVPYAVPDLVQLSDGTIVVGFNPRPSAPYSDDRKFGIRVLRSTDNGRSWSAPIFVFDAHSTFEDGCWEPSFLELPSGELQCYFANENNFTTSNEQEISMCRSFDGGLTWGEPVRICYRAGSRDGMPSAILTEKGEIVVIVEDNGWPGFSGFRATTVRTPLEENWSSWVAAGSDRRDMIFANAADKTCSSAAPYLRQLATGETIASWQGDFGDRKGRGESYFDMYVAVGDADARSFKAVTQPFGCPLSSHALWNSVAVAGDGTVFALASIGDANHGNAINVMRGQAMRGFEANYGTPVVDGSFSKENWTKKNAQQIYMGAGATRNRATLDFLYDNDNLYFFGRVVDRTIFTDKADNDGIYLYIDLNNASDTYPQEGMVRIFLNVDGSVSMALGKDNKWVAIDTPESVKAATVVKSTYYDIEAAIPWSVLGLDAAPVEKPLRCNIEIRDRREGEMVTEVIPETLSRQSWTWPEFKLNYSEESGAEAPAVVAAAEKASVSAHEGTLDVHAARAIDSVSVYSAAGSLLAYANGNGQSLSMPVPAGARAAIVSICYADGDNEHSKILIR